MDSEQAEPGPGALATVGRLAARGALALATRQVLVQGVAFLAGVVLARLYSPSFFGVYVIVLAAMTVLTTFSDVGFAASIIRQKEAPTERELRSVFTLHLAIVMALGLLGATLGLTGWATGRLEPVGLALVAAVLFALILASLRTVPSALLERDLAFDKQARIEVVDALIFYGTIVGGGLAGLGLWSLALAIVLRAGIDVLLVYQARPWRPRPTTELTGMRARVAFGSRFQASALLSLGKDQLWPFLLTAMAGTAAAGFYGVAYPYAAVPVVMLNLVGRVLFPTFARLQDNRAALISAVRAILSTVFVTGLPLLAGLTGLAPYLLPLIFGDRWLPAVPTAQLLSMTILGGFVTTPAFSLLYVTGHEAAALKLYAGWTVAQLVALVVAVLTLPVQPATAAAIAAGGVTLPVTWLTLLWAQRLLDARLTDVVVWPVAIAAIVAVGLHLLVGSGLSPLVFLPIAGLILAAQMALTAWLAPDGVAAIRRLLAGERA